MKRITLFCLLLFCVAQIASAQDWAKAALAKSPRHGEWVTIKHDGRSVETFVVYPESKGKTPVAIIIHEIFGMSDWVQELADEVAAADYALKIPASNGKLFVGGFCWGGGQTFRFATNRGDLAAAFVFYGPPPDKDAMVRIKAPVYGFFAGNDARIGAMIPDAIVQMKAAGKTFDPVTYDGAGHGFMRAGEAPDAKDADKKARVDAWVRWKSLLSK